VGDYSGVKSRKNMASAQKVVMASALFFRDFEMLIGPLFLSPIAAF
jgi:hypothetical protein